MNWRGASLVRKNEDKFAGWRNLKSRNRKRRKKCNRFTHFSVRLYIKIFKK